MALADLLGNELSGHEFPAVLHWTVNDTSGTMTNLKAKEIIEEIIGRSLTGGEQTQLLAIVADIIAGTYTVEDVERAQVLVEKEYLTISEAKAMLGW